MATRKNLSPQQKIAIVRQHLLEDVPVSDLCDKHGISPTNFYNWQKLLFENGAGAFERKANAANKRRQENAQQQKIDHLEARLQQKNEVIAELLEEHVQLKKANGEP
jgi:transposase-like protein